VAPVHRPAGSACVRGADLLLAVLERRGVDPATVRAGIGADPFGTLAATGRLPQGLDAACAEVAALVDRLAVSHPQVRVVAVDTTPYVEAGADEVQELAILLATGAAHLRALSAADVPLAASLAAIEVTLCADADVFTTLAKLRAARRVWARLAECCGAAEPDRSMQLHVRTATRMLTRRDPWVNLLRVTAAAFAAGVGGAASVSTAAFDSLLGQPDELGRRMARNTQLLLQQESNVGRVIDPAGGSWYVETLSDQIARAAWDRFVELERAGGLPAALLDGSLGAELEATREERFARIATRREPLTGVSEFADVAEAPVIRSEPDLRTLRTRAVNAAAAVPARPAGVATECEPLPQIRWAERFEALRDASDAYVAATGSRPKVFLVNLGPVAEHTARATFASNFFAAGGIEAVTSERGAGEGFDDPADAVADALAAAAHLVCICGSDERYATSAVPVASALRDAGLGPVYLAGNPGDRRDAETAAGVSEFIHVGVDVLDVLRRAHEHVGTPTGTLRR
jgi:methylmalonyl-CoA mutase